MRRLLLTENITADGRIEMLDEWFNPSPDGDIHDWLGQTGRLSRALALSVGGGIAWRSCVYAGLDRIVGGWSGQGTAQTSVWPEQTVRDAGHLLGVSPPLKLTRSGQAAGG